MEASDIGILVAIFAFTIIAALSYQHQQEQSSFDTRAGKGSRYQEFFYIVDIVICTTMLILNKLVLAEYKVFICIYWMVRILNAVFLLVRESAAENINQRIALTQLVVMYLVLISSLVFLL